MTLSQAAVFREPLRPMQIESFAVPELRGGDVLIRITCATICGSDLHTYFGRRHSPAPSVLGHEMVGRVAAIGPSGAEDYRGTALAVGDRVTWSMVWSCGKCWYCTAGIRPKCERLRKFGHEQLSPGCELFGGLAEHCYLPEGTAIFRVPDRVSDLAASPANCATATVAAVFRSAGECAGESVVVYGAGMLGLTACAMAATRGARVIAIERDAARAEAARQFGATAVLDGGRAPADLRREVFDLTERGADVVLEFTGDPDAIECGFELLRFGGRYCIAGAVFPARPIQVSAEQLVRRLLRVTGVYNYNPEDLETALEFLAAAAGNFAFDSLIGKSFPMSEVQQAFEVAESTRPPRVAIFPSRQGSCRTTN